jgi:DNA polymerase-1
MTVWSQLPLTAEHATYLRDQAAITAEVAQAAGIRSATSVDELPEWAQSWGEQAVPAIVFPWRSPAGVVVEQVRPDTPVVWDGEPHKYLWPRGTSSILNAVRPDNDADTVLIVEGTKQGYAAASWAPDGVAVYAIGGCRSWSTDGVAIPDLAVVEDRAVAVALDADAATNLEVYIAGTKLAQACEAEGARSVKYLWLPGSGTSGLDDVLAQRPPEKRTALLDRLIAKAKSRPAESRPKPRKATRPAPVVNPNRGMVFVDGDRLEVINQITRALLEKWDARRLFSHGEVLSMLTGVEMKPLVKGVFLDLLQETTATVRRAGDDGEAIVHTWPDAQTVDAVMSRAGWFAPLDRVARAPFIRPDGTVCQANGYDQDTGAMVVMDDQLTAIQVPDHPTDAEVALARKLLVEEWLGDFPFHSAADLANALALVLTPFVRGLMDKVPMAVIDGLQMGVGKNLLADCVNLLATGHATEPLPWTRDDEEVRKVITAAFRTGADIFVFDEAHHLDGAALARALTSATYKDRQLGVSQMLGFPNRVTWMSLGNQVRVEGDITRRVYRIALRPTAPNPESRRTDSFRHPDLLAWTREHRAELLTAALTLVRAWFAAGRPTPSRGVSFGSFETWERVVGGIVENARQLGFLDNLAEWKSETSFDTRYWTQHVTWLLDTFGSGTVFTCAQARDAMAKDPHSETPPGLTDLSENPRDYNRRLGQAYARMADRYFDGIQLVRASKGGVHNHVSGWTIVEPGAGFTPDVSESNGPVGGIGGIGGNPTPTRDAEKTSSARDASPRDYSTANARVVPRVGEGLGVPPVPPVPPVGVPGRDNSGVKRAPVQRRPDLDRVEKALADAGVEQPDLFSTQEPLPAYPTVEIRELDARGAVTLPEGVVALDIETASEEQLWARGPEFVRLCGYQTGGRITLTSDAYQLARIIEGATLVIGHNVMAFDLVAFARNYGVDLMKLAADGRVFDTKLAAILNDPPTPGSAQAKIQREYSLDNLGARLLGATKTGDLKALAKEHGGYDQIPLDDERYARYLVGDVDLTARLADQLRTNPYVRREHRVAAIAAQIRLSGFRVDVPELERRVAANRDARAGHLEALAARYGLPTTKKDGKPSRSPHATAEGKAAIVQAFTDLGVELPKTEKGAPSFGKPALARVAEHHADRDEVMALIELVSSLNGVRTVYETVLAHLHGDRVHPEIGLFQASGRWSTTKPGLTVMGKRGGKYAEREVFLPEPGHVIISADLAQVDARAIAALSQDPAYLAMFNPGLDLHREVATRVWGDPGRRDDAKAIGHGWNYGMGIAGLARNAKVSEDVAREFDRAMREQFPGLITWRDGVRADGEVGRLLDNGFGRLMRVDPNRAWTQAPALMGQGCARDLMMEGLLRLPADVVPMLRAVVHDEVILSVPVDDVDEVECAVVDALSFMWAPTGAEYQVQIEAGLGERRGSNWGDVYRK